MFAQIEKTPAVAAALVKRSSVHLRAVAPRLRLEPLSPAKIAQWDEIVATFPQRTVFHRRAWLNCLAESHQVEWRFWSVTQSSRVVGYFCGGIIQRGPFRMLGSPMRSWYTNYLGPLLREEARGENFAAALDDLAHEERLAIIEIEYPDMPNSDFLGAGYNCHNSWTQQVELSRDHREMLLRMSNGRKHGVRKSRRHGLEVVECEDAATRLYGQLTRALHCKGAVCPFAAEFPQAIVKHLQPAGLLYTLGVRNPEGEIVATGIFPFDNGTVYQWNSSSEIEGRKWHPNDLLHWELMCKAADDGLGLYDMSGYGRFNRAFGAKMVATFRWYKCYSIAAKLARASLEKLLRLERRQLLAGNLVRRFLS